MRILAVNAGTSSLKLSVIGDGDATIVERELGASEGAASPLDSFLTDAGEIDAVGHRFVHGGDLFREPVRVDDGVRAALDRVVELAPLHMPPALALLDVARERLAVPQVACFDTGFHASLPESAYTYALPRAWRAMGVRRYGFHGLSCAWSLRRAAGLLHQREQDLHILVAHLGSGASVTAIREGHSADTSMGFTPLEGVVMATRSGSVDPGALMWLQTARGVDAERMSTALEHESGLAGLTGVGDMRDVERRAAAGDSDAAVAIGVYVHRACAHLASVAASLDRVDALVFTGGVGEHAVELRESICAGLGVLGMPRRIATAADGADAVVSAREARPAVLVVRAREDLEMAREVRSVLAGS